MKKKLTKKGRDAREATLKAAVKVSERVGYTRVTRDQISIQARVSPATVSLHLGTMPQARRKIMRRAVRDENIVIVGQGLADGNVYVRKAPKEVKNRALAAMMG